jgi:hypothetical protein
MELHDVSVKCLEIGSISLGGQSGCFESCESIDERFLLGQDLIVELRYVDLGLALVSSVHGIQGVVQSENRELNQKREDRPHQGEDVTDHEGRGEQRDQGFEF